MTITGKLENVFSVKSGKSAKGNDWVAQEFLIETTNDKYPKKICFSVFGEDKIKPLSSLTIGDIITVDFDVESREWKGRWFTQLNAWRITKGDSTPQPQSNDAPTGDDLPF